jgi:hypothetical protein
MVVGCGPDRVVRVGADEVDIKSQTHALVSSEAAIAALGLDPATAAISFGTSDPVGYDVFTTAGSGFPTEGNSYLVLSSGCTNLTFTPNSSGSTSCTLGGLDTSAGQDLVQATVTTAVPTGAKCFLVDWKFFSDEYPEYVGTQYNDAFLMESGSSTFTISGTTITAPDNVAYDADGQLITVNTTGVLGMTPASSAGTTYDGATTSLTTQAPLADGQTSLTLVLSVMDLGDSVLDSTVFVDNIRFSGSPCGEPITTPWINQPPTIAVDAASVAASEGSPATNTGSFADPNLDDLTFSASIGVVSVTGPDTWAWSYTPVDGPATESVTITADDGRGGTASVTFALTVANVPPTVGAIAAPVDPVPAGATVTATAPVQDPGVLDNLAGVWEWGDGTTGAAAIADGTATGTHAYAGPGIYTLTLTVTDKDGASASSVFQYVVAYDPSTGFVTGGGWLTSPAGAYSADPTLTGKASFGFVAKYKKGATAPEGTTEFQFHAASLNFHSSSYSWLVIAGARAIYKGTGTVNGVAGYGFLLSAVDGQIAGGGGVDKFRIKIWDTASSTMLYDNMMGSDDNASPSTALGGGSITIHP